MNQNHTPLWESLKKYVYDGVIPYHMPGHKQGRAIHQTFSSVVGQEIFKIDLTEVEGLDNLHDPVNVIAEAQELAAQAFGAEKTYFLVNGASVGIEALIMTFNPGEEIIVPRNMHQSMLHGLILSGVKPIYIWPEYNRDLGLLLPVGYEAINNVIRDNLMAKGIFLVNPTYHGVCSDLREISSIVKAKNLVMMVDEAHGTHLSFHPELPEGALQSGADACVQGAHKVIGALTQAAYLHVSGQMPRENKLKSALQILQTTSPSYILMASLDIARMQMATEGEKLLEQTLEIAGQLRKAIKDIPGIYCFDEEDLKAYGAYKLDRTKITINVSGLSVNGFQVLHLLRQNHKIQAEMADINNILFFITIGDGKENSLKLIKALQEISHKYYDAKNGIHTCNDIFDLPRPKMVMTPRDAWQQANKLLDINDAIGQVCAETVVPYPPGIPLICPGETIDKDVAETIKNYHQAGFCLQGTGKTGSLSIKVIA